jgi:hypothetical protein
VRIREGVPSNGGLFDPLRRLARPGSLVLLLALADAVMDVVLVATSLAWLRASAVSSSQGDTAEHDAGYH